MIAFLKGVVAAKDDAYLYLDVGGVGYAVGMSQTGLSKLPEAGSTVRVYTYLQVSDSGVALYGFHSLEEKALFERLIGVAGVGPKVALAALSTFSPQGLASAIAAQDVAGIQRIPGVGKKTASRIVLELKGSLDAGLAGLFDAPDAPAAESAQLKGAIEALLSMGFTSTEADLALKGAPEGADETALLQYALRRIGANEG